MRVNTNNSCRRPPALGKGFFDRICACGECNTGNRKEVNYVNFGNPSFHSAKYRQAASPASEKTASTKPKMAIPPRSANWVRLQLRPVTRAITTIDGSQKT